MQRRSFMKRVAMATGGAAALVVLAPLARAGEVLSGLKVLVRDADGNPAPDVPVMVAVAGAEGTLNGGGRQLRTN